MFEKNGVEYSARTECSDWRYSAAVLGLIRFFEFSEKMHYDLKYDIDDDYIYYNIEDITEERFLKFTEDFFSEDMHHIFVENELKFKNEFTKEDVKAINERLLKTTTLKKYFTNNKFNGVNKDEVIDLINRHREEIVKETFRNKPNLYQNYINSHSLFSAEKDNCRILGYYIDMPKKGKSLSYNFNTATLAAKDDIIFDFIPFAFVMGSDAVFINNNAAVANLKNTNNALAFKLKEAEKEKGRALSVKCILFNMIIESSDYIDYDVEVILKKRDYEFFEALYIRKESIDIFKAIKKYIKDYNCFTIKYRINDNYYIDIQDRVIDAVLNMTNVTEIIQILLKDDTANSSRKYNYLINKLIEVNIMITGGKDMYQDKEKNIKAAKGCAFYITKNKLMSANNGSKIKTYRTKLTSALVFKDYKRFCDILMQLANYIGVELDFAYNLFVDFEKNEDIAYAFVNGLGAANNDVNKETKDNNKEV